MLNNEAEKAIVFEGDTNDIATLRSRAVERKEPLFIRMVLATRVVKTPAQAKLVLLLVSIAVIAFSAYTTFSNSGPAPLPFDQATILEDGL